MPRVDRRARPRLAGSIEVSVDCRGDVLDKVLRALHAAGAESLKAR